MTTQIVEGLELFSEAQLESLEFLPEELENIEFELYPNLESISPEQVAKDLEAYFEGGLEKAGAKRRRRQGKKQPPKPNAQGQQQPPRRHRRRRRRNPINGSVDIPVTIPVNIPGSGSGSAPDPSHVNGSGQ
jgi:hypothetical protein